VKRSVHATWVAFALLPVVLLAQGSTSTRFQFERMADIATPGQQRLDVDVLLLSGSQPFTVSRRGERAIATQGLNDLRLFAADGSTEIPYLLVPPSADTPVYTDARVLPITAIDAKDSKSSGFELDLQAIVEVNAVDLGELPAPFLKRFRLEGSGDRERWTQLIAEGTAFNLPAEALRHTLIEFAAGPYRYLRVTWDDTNSGRVPEPDRVTVRRVSASSPGPVLRSAVSVTRRQSEPGRSRFRLTLPAPRLPIVALELAISGGNVLRDARVLEAGLIGQEARPRLLGQTRLTRVVRDSVTADALRIPIGQPTEQQIDLVVDDGDNAPLELEGVTAVYAELPWIYFEVSMPGSIVARYGNAKLSAPRYDLEAERAMIPTTPARAAWRPQPPVTLATEPEGLPMPETGNALTLEGFRYLRDIPAGPAGLIAVPLDAAVLAHGSAPRRFNDLRIVDRENLQVPYLIELRDEPLIVDVSLERRDLPEALKVPFAGASAYLVRPPYPALPDARLVLTTRARVFQRIVTLGVVMPATERRPAEFVRARPERWIHADQDVAAPALIFGLPDSSGGELFLIVEEGDNQPLPIERASALMPSYAVRLFRRPDLPLRLLYGKNNVAAPQYDLQLLSAHVLGRTADEVNAGPEREIGSGDNSSGFDAVSPTVFWSVLGLTVVVLLALVARLIKREAV
jgi:hypothetical protein